MTLSIIREKETEVSKAQEEFAFRSTSVLPWLFILSCNSSSGFWAASAAVPGVTWGVQRGLREAVTAAPFCVLAFMSAGSCKWQTEPVGQEKQVERYILH